jgi:hypothetical protein
MVKYVYTVLGISQQKEVLHNGNIKIASFSMISGFHLGIFETFLLLGCYAVSILS